MSFSISRASLAMPVLPVLPVSPVETDRSRGDANADLFNKYGRYTDIRYPPTLAVNHPRSPGVHANLRSVGKSGKSTGATIRSAVLRDPAPVAPEVPIMPPLAQAGDRPAAIHDDARHDNPVRIDALHGTRLPGSDDATVGQKSALSAAMPGPARKNDVTGPALIGRARAMLTVFKPTGLDVAGDVYRTFKGAYAA